MSYLNIYAELNLKLADYRKPNFHRQDFGQSYRHSKDIPTRCRDQSAVAGPPQKELGAVGAEMVLNAPPSAYGRIGGSRFAAPYRTSGKLGS